MTEAPENGEVLDRSRTWPIQCPVDGRWLTSDSRCPDCGADTTPLRALAGLASSLLDLAGESRDGTAAAGLVEQAATLVPPTEQFHEAAADALERAGRHDLAIVRIQSALSIAPRREDLRVRASRLAAPPLLTEPDQPSRSRRARLALVATVLVLMGGLGGGVGVNLLRGGAAVQSPGSSAVAVASTPGSTSSPTATPKPTVEPSSAPPTAPPPSSTSADVVRDAISTAGDESFAALAVELVDGVLRVSGPVPDQGALHRLETLLAAAGLSVKVDLAGITVPAVRLVFVQRGDTLWTIAAREYGDPGRWPEIASANPSVRPGDLRVGQRLRLP